MATAFNNNGNVRAIRAIRKEVRDTGGDNLQCEYTSHGHCGYVIDGDVDNDTTPQWLAKAYFRTPAASIAAPSEDERWARGRSGRRWTRTGSIRP